MTAAQPPIDLAARRKSRRILVVLVALFIVPVLLALLIYRYQFMIDWVGVSSYGELVEPVVALDLSPELQGPEGEPVRLQDFAGQWLLVYPSGSPCEETCQRNLYHMHQIHIALNKDMHRVRPIAIDYDQGETGMAAAVASPYGPKLLVLSASASAAARLDEQITAATGALAPAPDSFYFIDTQGNLVLRFSASLDPGDVLKDIKKLLRISRIG